MALDFTTDPAASTGVDIEALFIGKLAPLGPQRAPSGIRKARADGPQDVTSVGLLGDHQGDTKSHGGPEKALHHYPRDHYAAWAADGIEAVPAAFGENISTFGLTEGDICIGDIYRLGKAVLQVSQGRQPCWRLNARFERPDMAYRVQKTGRTGWYYRVLGEGTASAGDALTLEERPQPHWPLTRLIDLLYTRTLDLTALAGLAAMPELAPSWRNLATRRLETGSVENWEKRLRGRT
ncbi:MOSC domain-containing protein [Mesorhizobium sp. A556]